MELSPLVFVLYKLAKYALYPLSWIIVLLGVLTVLALCPTSPARLRWIRLLSASTFLLALLLSNHLVADRLIGVLEEQALEASLQARRPVDAVIVLGGGVRGKGSLRPADQLSETSIVRTICGAALLAEGAAPKLVLSGGDTSLIGTGPTEAVEMKRLALRLGVPEQAIVLEDRSRTTYENAVESKRLLGQASVLLATSAEHIPRSLALFRKQGFDAQAAPCSYSAKNRPGGAWDGNPFGLLPAVEALRYSTYAVNELAGMVLYRVIGKL